MAIKDDHYTGGETEGGITSSYATNAGVKLKVGYSFMGSIYDASVAAAEKYGLGYDLIAGNDIAGFKRIAEAMMAQGL